MMYMTVSSAASLPSSTWYKKDVRDRMMWIANDLGNLQHEDTRILKDIRGIYKALELLGLEFEEGHGGRWVKKK